MRRNPLYAILVLSFLGNIYLLRESVSPTAHSPATRTKSVRIRAATDSTPPSSAIPASGEVANMLYPEGGAAPDWEALVGKMRSAEISDDIIDQILFGILLDSTHYFAMQAKLRRPWEPGYKEAQLARTSSSDFATSEQKKYRLLLPNAEPPESSPLSSENDRYYRYGTLNAEKTDQLVKLEGTYRSRWQVGDASAHAEFERRVETLLSPEEARDYWLFNSTMPSATRELQSVISHLSVDRDDYIQLADLAVRLERESSLITDPIKAKIAAGEAKVVLENKYREVFGDTTFLGLAARIDPVAASANEVYKATDLSPDMLAHRFIRASATLAQISAASNLENRRSIATKAYQELTDGLGPDLLARFDQTALGRALLVRNK